MAKKKAAGRRRAAGRRHAAGGGGSAAANGPARVPQGSVRIRMYCQGLGDCFLLTFPRPADKSDFHMLIDCGLILGTPAADERITQVARHIAHETGGAIDLLVGTHEHWDHVSGFVQAQEVFEKLKIKQTWLAWTEDPNDPLAKKLRKEREEKQHKLALALDHFRQFAADEGQEAQQRLRLRLAGLSSFFGIDLAAAAGSGLGKTGEAMQFLREQNARFLRPGVHPPPLTGVSGVEVFVLGPPTDEKLLKKDLPTKKGRETYEEEEHGPALALFGLDVPDATGRHENQPFEARYGMPLDAALSDPYFVQMYDSGLAEHPAAWRRIDDVGMFAATDLALKLDADTNNTSLALAIRLPNRKVLLFPGDAQVGNWESWHQVKLPDGRTTIQELLSGTVVYKVGHHGSHNATLRQLGLELMTSPELLALLPVDEKIAHDNKGWTKMPFVPLMAELRRRTAGRILRPDHEVEHPLTDLESGAQPNWTRSDEKFTADPDRSLYLETFINAGG